MIIRKRLLALVVLSLLIGWVGGTVWPIKKPAAAPTLNLSKELVQFNKLNAELLLQMARLDTQEQQSQQRLEGIELSLNVLEKTKNEKIDYLRSVPADESFRIFSAWLSTTDSLGW